MQVKNQQLELDMEQQTGSILGKEYIKAVYCHPPYLTYMQSTSCEMLSWMNLKLELRLLGEISITSDMQMTPPLWQNLREESEKVGLKLNIQKIKIMASGPVTSWQIDGETVAEFIFLGSKKSLQMVTASMKLRHLLFRRKVMTNLDGILKKQRH